MSRTPKPFTFELTQQEVDTIVDPAGEGGQQQLHAAIIDQLSDGNRTITLNDDQLGMLIRYMTQYGSGGFQGRLRKAFKRPLLEQLGASSD